MSTIQAVNYKTSGIFISMLKLLSYIYISHQLKYIKNNNIIRGWPFFDENVVNTRDIGPFMPQVNMRVMGLDTSLFINL